MIQKITSIVIIYDVSASVLRFIEQFSVLDTFVFLDVTQEGYPISKELQKHQFIKIANFEVTTTIYKLREKITTPWLAFFSIYDSITPNFEKQLIAIVQKNNDKGVFTYRNYFFMGEKLRFSSLQKQRFMVMLHIDYIASYTGHSLAVITPKKTIKTLVINNLYTDFDKFNTLLTVESKIDAALQYQYNERPSVIDIIGDTLGTFLKEYLLKKGVFYGKKGFILSYLLAFKKLKTHLFLWTKYRKIE